jgi:hypothetical protein
VSSGGRRGTPGSSISRRHFIGSATLAAAGAALPIRGAATASRSGNVLPGRIVIREDLNASSGSAVSLGVVKQMVDQGLMSLTGLPDPVSALESLLPGLDATRKIAIKVNCLNVDVPTRWEVVRAITDRVCETLGGAYPPGNITIYDRSYGLDPRMFNAGFNAGHFPEITIATDHAPDPNTTVLLGDVPVQLSSYIVNCDYLINCPVIKDHVNHWWTLGFKNHVGSVEPVACHPYEPCLLALGASAHLRDKTRLIALSAIHGTYDGGPGGPAQAWDLFPEKHTPNAVMLSTDPVTVEHWGIRLIDEERALRGLTIHDHAYCQHAAEPPYDLGVYDLSAHTVITSLPAPSALRAQATGSGAVLLQWATVVGAATYRIYRSTDPVFQPDPWGGTNLLAETTATSYTDPGGAGDPATNHYYVVRAHRACWESGDSERAGVFNYAC